MSLSFSPSRFRRPRSGRRRPVRLVAALTAGLLAVVLAACSPGAAEEGPVTISYAVWDQNQVPAMEQIVKKFNETEPEITVDIQVTPWEQYWTKLQTSATGGSAPDVFWMTNAYFPNYADGGVLASLQDRAEQDQLDLGQYVDAMTKAYTWDGKLYGLPKDVDTIGLWYNKALFDKAGVDYPTDEWTWQDVKDAAKKLTDREAGVYGIAAPVADQTGYYETIFQSGGYVVSPDGTKSGYDSPEAIAAIQYWVDFIAEGLSPSVQQMTDTEPESLFTSGKVAMHYNGSWAAIQFAQVPYAAENVDVVATPKGKVPGGVINGLANVMYAKSKHPESAWKFLRFLGSPEAAQIQAATGTVIPATKGTTDAWVKAYPTFNAQCFVDSLAVGSPMPASLHTAEWRTYATQEFTKAFTGDEPVEVVARRVAEQMNGVLADEK
jgi:multiple sugar transport system substrate-binding protein